MLDDKRDPLLDPHEMDVLLVNGEICNVTFRERNHVEWVLGGAVYEGTVKQYIEAVAGGSVVFAASVTPKGG